MDASKQRKIEGLLLKAWNDAREKMKSPLAAQEMPSYTFTLEDGSLGYVVGINGALSMNEVMELILSEELIGKRFSTKYLHKRFDELLSDLLKADPKRIQKQTGALVSTLVQKLATVPTKSWKVGIPVINLELSVPSFGIGSVVFANYNSDIGGGLVKKFNENFQTAQTTEKVKDFIFSKVTENYENKVIAIINVDAVDGEQAIMIGAAEIELAINVLLFYGRGAISNDVISYRMYVGARGQTLKLFCQHRKLVYVDDSTNY